METPRAFPGSDCNQQFMVNGYLMVTGLCHGGETESEQGRAFLQPISTARLKKFQAEGQDPWALACSALSGLSLSLHQAESSLAGMGGGQARSIAPLFCFPQRKNERKKE